MSYKNIHSHERTATSNIAKPVVGRYIKDENGNFTFKEENNGQANI